MTHNTHTGNDCEGFDDEEDNREEWDESDNEVYDDEPEIAYTYCLCCHYSSVSIFSTCPRCGAQATDEIEF